MIPKQDISPLSYLGGKNVHTMFLEPVSLEEVTNIFQNLKNNLSLTEGLFPAELKIANVLPLYKADDNMVFNNYRPVSLLCILSKVFEMYSNV